MLRGHRDLKVFQLSYKLAMEIFHLSRVQKPLAHQSNSSLVQKRCSESG